MRQFLRNLIFGDWLLKFFSLALAVLTWLAVWIPRSHGPVTVPGRPGLMERSFSDVPVTVVSSSANVHDLKVKPSELDILTVQGEKIVLEKLERRHLRVQIDITGAVPTNGLKRRIDVIAPAGVTFIRVQPEEAELVLPTVPETIKEAP